MVHPRTMANELARLFNGIGQPIYFLDEEQRVVFANAACQEWLGRSADELLRIVCRYHSQPEVSESEAIGAGLAPPPQASTTETVGTVACQAPAGPLKRRRARFLPLGPTPTGPSAILVLVEGSELGEQPLAAAPPPGEAARLHEQLRLYRHWNRGRFRADRLVGDSPAMRLARAQAALAAESRSSASIVGPAGSGRQYLAKAIHYSSIKSPGAFIPLACSVLGSELIESTVAAIAGKYARGDEGAAGTLLLNDADKIPPDVQTSLAATLVARPFPLRLLATASEPLIDVAARGEYSGELAALVSTVVIRLPPLAERRGDIAPLAQMFVEELNARQAKQVAGFTAEAMDQLVAHPWHGNLDELAGVVAECHAAAEGAEIVPAELPASIRTAAQAASRARRPEETIQIDEFLGRVERELIGRAMARAKRNKTKAARLLGITRPRLYRRLIQLGMEEPPPKGPKFVEADE